MNAATLVLRTLVRVLFPVQLVLGLLFWSGHLEGLAPVHMLIGLVLVAALWGLAVTAALAGAGPGIVALGLAWGLVVPVLGLTQVRLLPGDAHWVVQLVHLAAGLVLLALAERLASRIRRRTARPSNPIPTGGAR